MVNYVKESDLEMEVGNFTDSIANMVRGVQRYFDELYDYIPILYPEIISQKSKYLPLIMFLFSESDNIIKQKGISFVIEGLALANRKFDSFINVIESNKNYEFYNVPEKNLQTMYNTLIYDKFVEMSFSKEKMIIPEYRTEYDFVGYANERAIAFEEEYAKVGRSVITRGAILNRLYTELKYFPDVLNYIRELSENSSSVYATSQVIKIMISSIMIGYIAMKNIEPTNKDE